MVNNSVYGVHMHNIGIYGRDAWKRKRMSKKACMFKLLLLALLFEKCSSKPKMIKTDRINFSILKNCQA